MDDRWMRGAGRAARLSGGTRDTLPVGEGSVPPGGGTPPDGAILPTDGTPLNGGTDQGTHAGTQLPPPGDDGNQKTLEGNWILWGAVALAAALLIAAVVTVLLRRRRKKRLAKLEAASAEDTNVTVEKLHEQGARSSQQDSFFVSLEDGQSFDWAGSQRPGLLAVVADGMGGLSNGDRVSQTAATAIANGFCSVSGQPRTDLLILLGQAVRAVNGLLGPEGLRSSGSTLVMGLIQEGRFHCLSVGDSRICLYRDGALYQLNREHVFREELYLRAVNGEMAVQEAAAHPKGAGLTSFLGMGALRYVDLPAQPVTVRPGDVFVLMSDGVYNALTEEELCAALDTGPGAAGALDQAIRAKNYANQDNYTAVILRCGAGGNGTRRQGNV